MNFQFLKGTFWAPESTGLFPPPPTSEFISAVLFWEGSDMTWRGQIGHRSTRNVLKNRMAFVANLCLNWRQGCPGGSLSFFVWPDLGSEQGWGNRGDHSPGPENVYSCRRLEGPDMFRKRAPFEKIVGQIRWLFRFWRGSPLAPKSSAPWKSETYFVLFFAKLGPFRKNSG